MRRKGDDHLGMLEEAIQSQRREGDEPHDHDGTKGDPDPCGPVSLHEKETDENADGDGDDDRLGESLADLFEALDRGKHGDGGSDHAIAVEQGGSEKHHENDEGSLVCVAVFVRCTEKGKQGEHAAFALGGRMAEDGQVFERDHDRQ